MEVARSLKISHNAVVKWSREAGIEAPDHRPCGACVHPQRDEIDAALIENSVAAVRRQFGNGLKFTMLDRHRRLHLGMPVGRGYGAYPACKVCDHPDREKIDQALRDGKSRTGLAREYNAFSVHILRNHLNTHLDNPRRDAALAAAAEIRRAAASKLAARVGPPPGWFYCPECGSENVHSKGSGDWQEDLDLEHWHVTKCLDCGWPPSPVTSPSQTPASPARPKPGRPPKWTMSQKAIVLAFFEQRPGVTYSVAAVSDSVLLGRDTVNSAFSTLHREGQLERVARGRYRLAATRP